MFGVTYSSVINGKKRSLKQNPWKNYYAKCKHYGASALAVDSEVDATIPTGSVTGYWSLYPMCSRGDASSRYGNTVAIPQFWIVTVRVGVRILVHRTAVERICGVVMQIFYVQWSRLLRRLSAIAIKRRTCAICCHCWNNWMRILHCIAWDFFAFWSRITRSTWLRMQ